MQYVVEGRARERCGVEVRLKHLRGLGRVEPRGLVAGPSADRAADGSRRERLGPTLGGHGVGAAVDRIPDQRGHAGREVERVEHVDGPTALPPRADE